MNISLKSTRKKKSTPSFSAKAKILFKESQSTIHSGTKDMRLRDGLSNLNVESIDKTLSGTGPSRFIYI